MKGFIQALQFSTRIPIRTIPREEGAGLAKGMKYMPLIGGAIGLVMLALYEILTGIDSLVAAVTAILAEALITGGLHQDGLADTFDGFYCNGPRDDILKVMADSRLGTHGVIALTGVLLLKIAFVNAFKRPEMLFIMPVYARLAMVYGAAFSKSAKASGLGSEVIGDVMPKDALIASLITMAIAIYPIGLFLTGILTVMTLGLSLVFVRVCSFKIGGMTGDTLGALNEIVALSVLPVYGLFYFYV